MAAWRVAASLETLRHQFDAAFPRRNKASDGGIGDAAHATRDSDHNPWVKDGAMGVVTARDFTHDPAHGMDIDRLTDELAASRDSRIKYIIANGYILDSRPGNNPWRWVRYYGSNPHTKHFHLSVMPSKHLYDDSRPWNLPSLSTGGGGAAPGGGDDMPSAEEVAKAVWTYPVLNRRFGRKEYTETLLGSSEDRIIRQQIAPLRAQVGELVRLVGQREAVTAEDIAAALRAGLTADLLPVLREVVGEALGDDNADQANQIADSVLDRIGARLQEDASA